MEVLDEMYEVGLRRWLMVRQECTEQVWRGITSPKGPHKCSLDSVLSYMTTCNKLSTSSQHSQQFGSKLSLPSSSSWLQASWTDKLLLIHITVSVYKYIPGRALSDGAPGSSTQICSNVPLLLEHWCISSTTLYPHIVLKVAIIVMFFTRPNCLSLIMIIIKANSDGTLPKRSYLKVCLAREELWSPKRKSSFSGHASTISFKRWAMEGRWLFPVRF